LSGEAGQLTDWDDDKGFGFIRTASGERLFVHISAFRHAARRPLIGDRVAFTRGPGRDGRPAAVSAVIAGLSAAPREAPVQSVVENAQMARARRIAAAALLLLLLMLAHFLGRAPDWLIGAYLLMGLVSAVAYWLDKRAAQAGAWRASEERLHALDLAAGIIGGLLAQAALHHKTAKPGFALVTWGIVVLHAAVLAALSAGLFPRF